MTERLFLYIDILGFKNLVEKQEKAMQLFRIINEANIHRDRNFKAIVFSDTIVAYNKYSNLSHDAKVGEVMYLIELTQDIFRRLIGFNVFFRAIITEGDFIHKKMENLQAYFGPALVETYLDEKGLTGSGLFLNNKIRKFNEIFRYKEFSKKYDFIFLTLACSRLVYCSQRDIKKTEKLEISEFPLNPVLFQDGDIDCILYPELVHLREIYENMNNHPDPKVRSIFLTTWNMYSLAYPGLTINLINHNFDPKCIANIDWSDAQKAYETNKA
jgi:hypothetical protein